MIRKGRDYEDETEKGTRNSTRLKGLDSRNYEDEREKGFEAERQLALEEILPWIESLSEEELDQPCLVVGAKMFTPQQILSGIEELTQDGRLFVQC